MDNLTHTVIGAIAGEALARYLPGRLGSAGNRRRPLYLAAGMLGGNLPDLDLLWSYRGRDGVLGYLLDHRGYTHTVAGCLLLGLALAAGLLAWARRHGGALPRAEALRLLAVALIASALHLGMDALNSYGVHPFWPLDDRWYYGDAVFIVEPWYWVAAAPLILLARTRLARVLLVGLQGFAGAACLFSGQVPLPCALALCLAGALLLLAARPAPQARAAALAAGAFVLVTALFLGGSRLAQARLGALAAAELPAGRLLDAIVSPLPADPLCWDALCLSVEAGHYVARRAVVALAPALIPAAACRDRLYDAEGLAAFAPAAAASPAALRWRTYTLPVAELAALVQGDCAARALMQFVRAPFVSRDAGETVLGDLRFDRGPDGGFAQLHLGADGAQAPCRRRAPWVAPRAALLGP